MVYFISSFRSHGQISRNESGRMKAVNEGMKETLVGKCMSATYGSRTKSKHELNSNKSLIQCRKEENTNEGENINQHKSNTEQKFCL